MLTTASDFFESLVSACRAGIGDDLRSLVYLTPETTAVLYTRADLADDDRERTARRLFVENERSGFDIEPLYAVRSQGDDGDGSSGSGLGEYELTVRVFDEGFVSRVIVGDHGVLATTDEIDADAFREVAVTLRKLLSDGPTA